MDMEKDNRIPPPFTTPEGYFSDFESRLTETIREKETRVGMRVTHKGKRIAWSAAAAVALAAAGLWFFTQTENKTKTINTAAIDKTDSLLPETVLAEAEGLKKIEMIETAVITEMIEPQGTAISRTIASKEDQAIAETLEEEDLISLEIEDGLFDEIEI